MYNCGFVCRNFNTSIDLFLKQSKTGVHYEMRAKINWGKDVRSDLFYHLKALSGMRSSNDLTFELKRGVGGGGGDVVFKTDLFQTGEDLGLYFLKLVNGNLKWFVLFSQERHSACASGGKGCSQVYIFSGFFGTRMSRLRGSCWGCLFRLRLLGMMVGFMSDW